jgi:hypothetical protein
MRTRRGRWSPVRNRRLLRGAPAIRSRFRRELRMASNSPLVGRRAVPIGRRLVAIPALW